LSDIWSLMNLPSIIPRRVDFNCALSADFLRILRDNAQILEQLSDYTGELTAKESKNSFSIVKNTNYLLDVLN
jgi:hypothetical protein